MHSLIIDTSYLMYRSYFAYPNLTTKTGKPAGAFFGFAKTVLWLIDQHKPDYVIFATDTPKPTWRHVIHTEYKAGRPPLEESMRQQIPVILDWINLITKNVYTQEGYEADDIIYTLAAQQLLQNYGTGTVSKETLLNNQADQNQQNQFLDDQLLEDTLKKSADLDINKVSVFSSDKDLYQLFIFEHLQFLKTKKGFPTPMPYTADDFKEEFLLQPSQWLDYKALVGDASDNLKGISGIGPKTAIKILNQCGSLHALLRVLKYDDLEVFQRSAFARKDILDSQIESLLNQKWFEKWKESIQQNLFQLMQTYALAGLSLVPELPAISSNLSLTSGIELFQEYGFDSLVKKLKPQQLEESSTNLLF